MTREHAWREHYPGAEAALAAAGIDPDRVYRITGEEGMEVWRGDIEVFYRRLRVEHLTTPTDIEGAVGFRPALPSRLVETILPWPRDTPVQQGA